MSTKGHRQTVGPMPPGNRNWLSLSRTTYDSESLRNVYPLQGSCFREGFQIPVLSEVGNGSSVPQVSSAARFSLRCCVRPPKRPDQVSQCLILHSSSCISRSKPWRGTHIQISTTPALESKPDLPLERLLMLDPQLRLRTTGMQDLQK